MDPVCRFKYRIKLYVLGSCCQLIACYIFNFFCVLGCSPSCELFIGAQRNCFNGVNSCLCSLSNFLRIHDVLYFGSLDIIFGIIVVDIVYAVELSYKSNCFICGNAALRGAECDFGVSVVPAVKLPCSAVFIGNFLGGVRIRCN